MPALFALLFFTTAAIAGFLGLLHTAPRRNPGRYAVPAAGTTALILTLAALAAAVLR